MLRLALIRTSIKRTSNSVNVGVDLMDEFGLEAMSKKADKKSIYEMLLCYNR